MKPTDEYKASLSNAIAFKHEYTKERSTTATRIYNVNDNIVRTILHRERQRSRAAVKHGGHNKVLSEVQVEAIYKYIEDLYLSRYSTTKAIVYIAIGCLNANEIPIKEPPS